MELILFIGLLFLWASYSGLSNRVKNLERYIDTTHATKNSKPSPINESVSEQEVPRPMYENRVAPGTVSSQSAYQTQGFTPHTVRSASNDRPDESRTLHEDGGNTFFDWLKDDFLMKLGSFFLLLGLGWFVTYAFMHEWIGPAGRIALGLFFGVSVMALGAWRIRVREHQGAIFIGLGSAVVLLTVFAGRNLYNFFTPHSALGLIFLTVLFVTFVSLKYRRNSLALGGLILAAIAPYFTVPETQNMNDHFLYTLMIVLGTLWVVFITGWRNLTFAALIIVFLTVMQYMGMYNDHSLILLWTFIFTAIFFVANIVSLIRQRGAVISIVHLWTALGTALLLIIGVFGLAEEELQSLLFVAWMLVFSVGSYLVYRSTTAKSPFYVYSGTSVALLAAATIAELDGTLLTIAFTIEIAVLVIIAEVGNLGRSVVQSLSALFIVPVILSVESIAASEWEMDIVIHEHFFNLVILMLVLSIVGVFLNGRTKARGDDQNEIGMTYITVSALYLLTLIWLILHALFPDDVAMTFILIIYTIIGIALYYTGKTKSQKDLSVAGGALLGFVALRLLFVEVWSMDLATRIITFVAIGVLLLSTAFMSRTPKQIQD